MSVRHPQTCHAMSKVPEMPGHKGRAEIGVTMFISRYKEKLKEIKRKKEQDATKPKTENAQSQACACMESANVTDEKKQCRNGAANEEAEKKDDIVRKHMKVYGRVQGVGFRYSARYCALELGLAGWVRNEWDGSVEMEVQGAERQIHRLMQMLNSGKFISIEKIEEKMIPMVEGDRKFSVL